MEIRHFPQQLVDIVGREPDLEAIKRHLTTDKRLVAIVGPGGMGKTRLLVETAERLQTLYSDHGGRGCIYLDATFCNNVDELCQAVCMGLGERGQLAAPGISPAAASTAIMRGLGRAVVCIDNVEQLLPALNLQLVEWLASSHVSILLTSRISLDVPGHVEHQLGPLPTPATTSLEAIKASPAWQLFIQRAREARAAAPGNPLALPCDEDALLSGKIVQLLEGVPLALELAASSARFCSFRDMLERAQRPLDGFGKTGPDKHSSLRRALADTLKLVPSTAMHAFPLLAAFHGPFSRDDWRQLHREVLPQQASDLSSAEVRADESLDHLCSYGLVQFTGAYYQIYESVRERAGEDHPPDALWRLRLRHAEIYAMRAWQGVKAMAFSNDLALMMPNARYALETTLQAAKQTGCIFRLGNEQRPAEDLAAALALWMECFFVEQGDHRSRLELLTRIPECPDRRLQALVLCQRGAAYRELGSFEEAKQHWHACLALLADHEDAAQLQVVAALVGCRQAEVIEVEGDLPGALALIDGALVQATQGQPGPLVSAAYRDNVQAEVLLRKAHILRRLGEVGGALGDALRAHSLFQTQQNRLGLAAVAYELGVIRIIQKEWALATQCLELARSTSVSKMMKAAATLALGIATQARGDVPGAIEKQAEAARIFREIGHPHREGSALYSLASAYLEQGDPSQGLSLSFRALSLIAAVGAKRYLALIHALQTMAMLSLGNVEEASRCLELAEAEAASAAEANVTFAVYCARCAVQGTPVLQELVEGDDAELFYRLYQRCAARQAGAASVAQWDPAGLLTYGENVIDVRRRNTLKKILGALVEERLERPGTPLTFDALTHAAWHDNLSFESASNRLHVALSTLRSLGLRDLLQTVEGGYQVNPAIAIVVRQRE
ncbi:MAG: hypothetical protein IPL79_00135 [Myxococcales bacterium]|nr:hypothetical protein [Myxococcales bacterium]